MGFIQEVEYDEQRRRLEIQKQLLFSNDTGPVPTVDYNTRSLAEREIRFVTARDIANA